MKVRAVRVPPDWAAGIAVRKPPASGQRALDDRLARMIELRTTGATLERIGEEFGLTRERVRQILARAGLDMATLARETATRRRQNLVFDRAQPVRAQPIRAISPPYRKYTDEELLACLRVARQRLGQVVTIPAYTDYAFGRTLPVGRPWPSYQTVILRFGSWRGALEAAGLESNPASPIAGRYVFGPDQCVDAILELGRALGRLPTSKEYARHAATTGGTLPSLATIRHRWGTWGRAFQQAAERYRRGMVRPS